MQNIIGLIPLALILGEITEDLAVRFGPTIGGLLNATFGNVVELILSIVALTKGLYTVVASSLVGSILSNLLLVLGKLPHVPCGCRPAVCMSTVTAISVPCGCWPAVCLSTAIATPVPCEQCACPLQLSLLSAIMVLCLSACVCIL